MRLESLHEAFHSFTLQHAESLTAHLLVASALSLLLLVMAVAIRDHRTRRLLQLGAVLVFLVPLPDLAPDQGVRVVQAMVADAAPVALEGTTVRPRGPQRSLDVICFATALSLFVSTILTINVVLTWHRARRQEEPIELRNLLEDPGRPADLRIAAISDRSAAYVSGVLQPRIVVPGWLIDDRHREALEAVLQHELAHLRNHDNLWRFLGTIASCLFWFNPLVWISVVRFQRSCELVADDDVLASGVTPSTYLSTLRNFIEPAALLPRTAFGAGSLRERIDNMKSNHRSTPRWLSRIIVILVALIATTAGLALRASMGNDARNVSVPDADRYLVAREVTERPDGNLTANFIIFDRETNRVLAGPGVTFEKGKSATVRSGDDAYDVMVEIAPIEGSAELSARVTIESAGETFVRSYPFEEGLALQNAPNFTGHYTSTPAAFIFEDLAKVIGADLLIAADLDDLLVTADFDGVRSPAALQQLANDQGLLWRLLGKTIVIVEGPNSKVTPTPLPHGSLGEVYRVGGKVRAPRIIERVDPVYTEEARRANVSGIVILEATIDETGRVVAAEVSKPLPFGLSQSALDAVKQWKFEPATLDGKPVAVVFSFTVNFRSAENGGNG